jgi:hypothetical protein
MELQEVVIEFLSQPAGLTLLRAVLSPSGQCRIGWGGCCKLLNLGSNSKTECGCVLVPQQSQPGPKLPAGEAMEVRFLP